MVLLGSLALPAIAHYRPSRPAAVEAPEDVMPKRPILTLVIPTVHVHPGTDELSWDMAFLLWGVLLIGLGWLLVQRGHRRSRSSEGSALASGRRPTEG